MSTSMPLFRLPTGSGGVSLPANQFKKLTFANAPADMEFGLSIGEGTDPIVFRGDIDTEALLSLLEGCDDLVGYTIQLFGSTEQTGTGADGVALYSGSFTVVLEGASPYPVWSAVLNSEVQNLTVENGDTGDTDFYALNGGSDFVLATTESALQVNQRTLGGDYANVTVKGRGLTYPNLIDTAVTSIAVGGTIPNHENGYDHDLNTATGGSGGAGNGIVFTFDTPRSIGGIRIKAVGTWSLQWPAGGTDIVPATALDGSDFVEIEATNHTAFDNVVIRSEGAGYILYEVEIYEYGGEPITPNAVFNSYFPYSAGDVANPAATGTDATVSTVYAYGSTTGPVTCADADLETVIVAALENPVQSGGTAEYTPANPSHWDSVSPTTIPDAVNRLAYAFNDIFADQIP